MVNLDYDCRVALSMFGDERLNPTVSDADLTVVLPFSAVAPAVNTLIRRKVIVPVDGGYALTAEGAKIKKNLNVY